MKKINLIILLISLILSFPAKADKFGIVAVVNGEAISNFALSDRIDFIISSAGLQDTPEIRRQLVPQALQSAINEALQRQDAANFNIKVTEKDLKSAVKDLEAKNNLLPEEFDTFLAAQDISKETMMQQITSQIAWQKIIARRIRPRITISDYEVEDAMDYFATEEGTDEIYLSEIFLPVAEKEQEASTLALAQKIIEEIKGGASFSAVAKQFSASSTAQEGGVIGWIAEGKLEASVQSAIKEAKAHEITQPIRVEGGYRIIKIGNRRVTESAEYSKERIREALFAKKMELESRRYMKELRNNSFIEIRL